MRRKRKGLFITFEGPDGSGKTTQARRLAGVLESQGHSVVLTREPGGTPFGDSVRDILLRHVTEERITSMTELLLYESIRAHHVENLIRPAIEEGRVVICDRFIDASLAYQGYGRGVPLAQVKTLNKFAAGGLLPDLTLLLDVSPEIGLGMARRSEGKETKNGELDRIESAGPAFHRRVRRGYLEIARRSRRFEVVKRARDKETTFARIIEIVRRRFPALFTGQA